MADDAGEEVDDRLRALFAAVIPADTGRGDADTIPSVADGTILDDHLAALAADPQTVPVVDRLRAAAAASGSGPATDALAAMDPATREELIEVAASAFYGGPDRPGARVVGYDAGPTEADERWQRPLRASEPGAANGSVDVVIVGAGPGGSTVAAVLAEAGARVLVIERGAADHDAGRDHLRNHRSPVHGIDTGPPPGTRRYLRDSGADADSVRTVDTPHDPAWHNTAMVAGGGTRVYGAVAWPWLAEDFALATRHGVPDGSSLADWPFGRDELAPHYAWVQDRWGVSGDHARHPALADLAPPPMAPVPPSPGTAAFAAGAERLGWAAGPVPLLVNTEPRGGRGPCVRCGECAGFPCPTEARAGAHNTVLADALATGNATLVADTQVTAIDTDGAGRVTGVAWHHHPTGAAGRVRAGAVVVAAGAIETARLLLASRSASHPDGLGNHSGHVGRHLQGHGFVSAFGHFDEPVTDDHGPGPTIATLALAAAARAEGVIGAGVLADELVKQPIVHWRWSYPPDAPRWGVEAARTMRDTFHHTGHLFGHVQELPRPDNRVRLSGDAGDVDRAGVPRVVLAGAAHPETVRAGAWMAARAEEWMAASGADRVWSQPMATGLLAGTHQAGTARMGADPATSVVDPTGRVHGHDNLWVADASVHVTNGSTSPTLTIAALAHRLAHHLNT